MAITRINRVSARSSGGATVTTPAIDTTNADFLVAIADGFNAPATWASGDLTDSKGNTWTMRTALAGGVSVLQVWDCVPTSVGASHTFTASATNVGFASICVAAYRGVHQTTPFDQQIRLDGGTSTTVQPASLTPAESGELIMFAVGTASPAGTITADAGFTVLEDVQFLSGNAMGAALAEKIKTDAVAEHPTLTDTTTQDNFLGTTIAYKAAVPVYRFIGSAQAGSTDNANVVTSALNTVGADLLVINLSWYYGTTAALAPSDSAGNTWTGLTVQTGATNVKDRLFYCYGPTTSATHTFSAGGTSAFPSVQALAFSGAVASPFDLQTGAVGNATSLATGSLTPSATNELVIAGIAHENNSSGAVSVNGGLTAVLTGYTGNHEGGGIGYLIQTAAVAANPTWSITNAAELAVTLACFKTTAAGGGSSWGPGLAPQLNRIVQGE